MRATEKRRLELSRLIGRAQCAFEILRQAVDHDAAASCAINQAETAATALYHIAFTPPDTRCRSKSPVSSPSSKNKGPKK
jgi:hypothetical protein